MRVLSSSSTAYRRSLLKGYLTHEKAAVRSIRTAGGKIAKIVETSAPSKARDVAPTVARITPILKGQANELRATLRAAYRDAAESTLTFHAAKAGKKLDVARGVAALVKNAQNAVVAEHTVGGRISLLAGAQKKALQTRLLLGIKRGESPGQMVAAIKKLYVGAIDGSSGAAYAARRLVQSELTRFHGRVAEEAAYELRKATGRITIFVYRTQGDDVVRDEHEELDGEEFVEDEAAEEAGYRPLSEAQDALSAINCRCWLDVGGYVEV